MTGGFSAVLVAEDGGSDGQHWAGQSRILGPKWMRFPALTVGLVGLQVFWSVEMSYASPYLLDLGLSKSHMALVFLAGPLSGLIVQPLVGLLADSSKSRFGRRRPYMIIGSVFCVFAMILLGYTRAFANIFSSSGSQFNDTLTIWLAVLAIYCMDFAINAVQAVDRALLVDTLPATEQATGNAWAAQMLGIGGVIGFFFGEVDLTGVFGWLGEKQLKILAVISSLLLIGTHGMTASLVKERVLVSTSKPPKGFKREVILIWQNIRTLPPVIRQICIIQFFAWIGWFPTIFYTTTYIGELYKRASPVPETDEASMLLNAEATRLGTRALFFSSIVSLATNFLAPYLVVTENERERSRPSGNGFREVPGRGLAQRLRPPKMHIATLWAISHGVFAACMGATFFVESVWAATMLVLITGFAWAVTMWAPFSLIGEAILSSGSDVGDTGSIRLADARRPQEDERAHFLVASDDEDEDEVDGNSEDAPHRPPIGSRRSTGENVRGVLGNVHARQSSINIASLGDSADTDKEPAQGGGGDLAGKAGVILGIHNIFVVIPQFLVTALSSLIFALFEPDMSVLHGTHPGKTIPPVNGTIPGTEVAQNVTQAARAGTSMLVRLSLARREEVEAGVNSVAVIFRIGGAAALVACALTWRLAKEIKRAR